MMESHTVGECEFAYSHVVSLLGCVRTVDRSFAVEINSPPGPAQLDLGHRGTLGSALGA